MSVIFQDDLFHMDLGDAGWNKKPWVERPCEAIKGVEILWWYEKNTYELCD